MAELVKPVVAKEIKPTVVKKEEEKSITLVSVCQDVLKKPHKTRKEVVTEVLAICQRKGIVKTSKGTPIAELNTSRLITAMCADIKSKKKGWWSTWDVVETETLFQAKPKAQ